MLGLTFAPAILIILLNLFDVKSHLPGIAGGSLLSLFVGHNDHLVAIQGQFLREAIASVG